MGKVTGFKEYERIIHKARPVEERVKDYKDVYEPISDEDIKIQAARCMSCGTPFCNYACPLSNIAPDFNDMIYKGQWEKAFHTLSRTSSFPEFTGRVCPALCEGSCTLNINRKAVSVREIELAIIEKAYENGWIKPKPPRVRTDKRVAVIGSGPAGLSAAQRINQFGHNVTVFEKADEIGGLLRYGIPDFKLEKWVIDRRVNLLREEGIKFKTNSNIGNDIDISDILKEYDAVLLTGGSTIPRDLKVEGRELDGIYFAVDYLMQQNKRVSNKPIEGEEMHAKNKTVLVMGGGDTGSDCVGTAIRQGAKAVYQFEIMPMPPEDRDETMPWPEYPRTLKTTTSHEEGCNREWCISTKRILGKNGKVKSIEAVRVKWQNDDNGRMTMQEIQGSEFILNVDIILISMGFLHPKHEGIIEKLNLSLDNRGNIKTDESYMTSYSKVFSAGDMRTGQSLVVRAISDGRKAAEAIDKFLMK